MVGHARRAENAPCVCRCSHHACHGTSQMHLHPSLYRDERRERRGMYRAHASLTFGGEHAPNLGGGSALDAAAV